MTNRIQTAIWGGCVSRDTFGYLPKRYSLTTYVARQSWISWGNVWPGPNELDKLTSPFQRRMAEGDALGNAFATIVEAGEPDLILFDLMSERTGVIVHPQGGCITRSVDKIMADAQDEIDKAGTKLAFGTPEHFNAWSAQAAKLLAELETRGWRERVLVLAPESALVDEEGNPTKKSFGLTAAEMNSKFAEYLDYLEAHGLRVVRIKDTLGGVDHKWGPAPFHYDEKTYLELASAIDEFASHLPNVLAKAELNSEEDAASDSTISEPATVSISQEETQKLRDWRAFRTGINQALRAMGRPQMSSSPTPDDRRAILGYIRDSASLPKLQAELTAAQETLTATKDALAAAREELASQRAFISGINQTLRSMDQPSLPPVLTAEDRQGFLKLLKAADKREELEAEKETLENFRKSLNIMLTALGFQPLGMRLQGRGREQLLSILRDAQAARAMENELGAHRSLHAAINQTLRSLGRDGLPIEPTEEVRKGFLGLLWAGDKQAVDASELRELRKLRQSVNQALGVSASLYPGASNGVQTMDSRLDALQGDARDWERLMRGESIGSVLVQRARRLLTRGELLIAKSMAARLLADEHAKVLGHAAMFLVAHHQRLYRFAAQHLECVPQEMAYELFPVELFTHEVRESGEKAASIVPAEHLLAVANHSDVLWAAVAAYAAGSKDYARALLDGLEADENELELQKNEHEQLASLRAQLDDERPVLSETGTATVDLLILGPSSWDVRYSSRELGDYLELLGALTSWARFEDLEFVGDPDMVRLLTKMQSLVLPAYRRRLGTPMTANLIVGNRDDQSDLNLRRSAWTLAVGDVTSTRWDGQELAVPYSKHTKPVLASVAIPNRNVLTSAMVTHMRKGGPVGCRDAASMELLRAHGVDAYFAGSALADLSALAWVPAGTRSNEVALLDVSRPDSLRAEVVAQRRSSYTNTAEYSLLENLEAAWELFEWCQSHSETYTSKLAFALALTSLGKLVTYLPAKEGDRAHDGLYDADGAVVAGPGIFTRLEPVIRAVLTRESTASIRKTLEDACASAVADARAQAVNVSEQRPNTSLDIQSIVQRVQADATRYGPSDAGRDAVVVALASDERMIEQVPIVVHSIVSRSSAPVSFEMLVRGWTAEDAERLSAQFPDSSFRFLPCDRVSFGDVGGMLSHITMSTMDRLLLPELLPDRDRVIYHDIDAVTQTDIVELWNRDLGGNPLGARTEHIIATAAGTIFRTAQRFGAEQASHIRAHLLASWPLDVPYFNAGIMLLDLQTMRSEQFCQHYLGYATEYGMNDQEVLNLYAAGRVHELGARWNGLPAQEILADDLGVVHWAGRMKPWDSLYVSQQSSWDDEVAVLADARSTEASAT